MTKEEKAIEILHSYLPKDEPMNTEDREAFFIAIEALGQNLILDQIRAEINSLTTFGAKFTDGLALHIDKHSVLQIIDKYKAESEGKE